MNANMKFNSTFEYKLIYVFRINDGRHSGCLKIGDATIHTSKSYTALMPNCHDLNYAAKERIDAYTSTAGIIYELLHTEIAVYINDKGKLKAFRDYKVHDVLKRSGVQIKKFETSKAQNEWFKCDLETAKQAIKAVKEGKTALNSSQVSNNKNPIIFRPEQKDAINKTIARYKKDTRMLWNAKMRFGKTLTALEVAKQMGFKRTIIITHRPVVSEGWFDDFNKIFYDRPDYFFGSKTKGKTISDLLKNNNNFVYFASMQDLRGSDKVGGSFDKNDDIFKTDWDFVVVDEAHEGTKTELGINVLNKVIKENKNNIYKTYVLELSGTPFNLLTDFEQESIYTWDYIMEQEAKTTWDKSHFGDSNPYEELPRMNIYTYHLEKSLPVYIDVMDKAFNFREFFRLWTGDINKDGKSFPKNVSKGDFVHEQDIKAFLDLICKKDEKTNYPFSTNEYRNYFRHSLWVVSGVKEAKALSTLLRNHHIFKNFTIVNVAGDGDEEIDTRDALKAVKDAMSDNPDETYTITLSCGRLTTGVSIPEWTAVLMLAGTYSTAASQYLQTIFRVQTPANINGKIKEECYVFDFAPDRTLKMIAESVQLSSRAGANNLAAELTLSKFLNYCPVISITESNMKEYKVAELLQELKKAYAERVARNGFDDPKIYNDELLKLSEVELKEFENLKKIIGTSKQTKKAGDIDINKEGFTDEETEEENNLKKKPKKELSEEEKARLTELKEKRKNRDSAISILRAISIRMPLLVYGMDIDIAVDVTIDNFADLIDNISWEEFMPKGVDKATFKKFSKYYDKDIFVAASRRIRYIAKTADELEPTERVKKIASLFATFKNPDKETVLTPWRVVNMHMSQTLGGYCFYDEKFENILDEPRYVDQGDVTRDTFNNPDANILEINSKTGLYPLYVTYSVYRNIIKDQEISFENKLRIWDKIIFNNIYVICKTPMAKAITRRTLLGYRSGKINAHAFDDLINQMKEKQQQLIQRIKNPSFWNKGGKEMKFDAVVGNPPYQENIAGRSEQPPVYHFFYDTAFNLARIVSLITPARFLFDAGKTPTDWNHKMLNDEHLKVIHYYSNSKEVFPTVEIKGGVVVTLRDKINAIGPIVTFVTDDVIKDILIKITNKMANNLSDIVYSNTSYKYNDAFFYENPGFSDRVSGGSSRYLSSSVFDKFPEVFYNTKPVDGMKYASIIGRQNNRRKTYFFKEKYLVPPENYSYYKVLLASSNGSGEFGEALSLPIIGEPGVGSTETFVTIGKFENKYEAENLVKYIKTKFYRAMLSTKKVTQGNKNSKVFENIPLLDFTDKSDVPWTSSISEIDNFLFKKFDLSEKEITFILENVQEMK